jgi:Protein of unknown function (DUF732)
MTSSDRPQPGSPYGPMIPGRTASTERGEGLRAASERSFSGRRRPTPISVIVFCATVLGSIAVMVSPVAHGDAVAYLVNVTVRPGYNFANADDAIGYGRGICDKVAHGRSYAALIGDVKTDFSTGDDYQASYLIAQAVNELCPAQIWQLRNTAAGYHPGSAS